MKVTYLGPALIAGGASLDVYVDVDLDVVVDVVADVDVVLDAT